LPIKVELEKKKLIGLSCCSIEDKSSFYYKLASELIFYRITAEDLFKKTKEILRPLGLKWRISIYVGTEVEEDK